jgi:hypothetical protein
MRAYATVGDSTRPAHRPDLREWHPVSIIGAMWGSDDPHPDGVCPESSKYIDEQFAGLPAETVHKITCENAGKFYGLIN